MVQPLCCSRQRRHLTIRPKGGCSHHRLTFECISAAGHAISFFADFGLEIFGLDQAVTGTIVRRELPVSQYIMPGLRKGPWPYGDFSGSEKCTELWKVLNVVFGDIQLINVLESHQNSLLPKTQLWNASKKYIHVKLITPMDTHRHSCRLISSHLLSISRDWGEAVIIKWA